MAGNVKRKSGGLKSDIQCLNCGGIQVKLTSL